MNNECSLLVSAKIAQGHIFITLHSSSLLNEILLSSRSSTGGRGRAEGSRFVAELGQGAIGAWSGGN